MENMTVQQMTEYLKQVSNLEISLYQQTRIKAEAQKNLVQKDFPLPYIEKPRESAYAVCPPVEPYVEQMNRNNYIALIVIGIIVFLFGLICSFQPEIGAGDIFACCTIMLVGVLIIFFTQRHKNKLQAQEEQAMKTYQAQVNEYHSKKAAAEAAYKEELAIYTAKVEEARKVCAEKQNTADRNYSNAQKAVYELDAPLLQTQELLKQVYDKDIIFAKYRNLFAMCTMYEYFASGRCTELTGPNGAYNPYEAELRQNLIINRLDLVNANLEQIKQNQYVLYQGITAINTLLDNISHGVKSIVNATEVIAESSVITAHCSRVTAANSEAIKYLSMIN